MAAREKSVPLLLLIIALAVVFFLNVPASAGGLAVWRSLESETESELYGIWGYSSTDVFAVGNSGTALHYDGSVWSAMDSGTTKRLNAVWGGEGAGVIAAGESGTILNYRETGWSPSASGITEDLRGLWGTDGSNVFAVGNAGTIIHYDGSGWSSMESGITEALYGIWGISGKDIFAVGENGAVIHYDGTGWSQMNSGAAYNLYCVWGTAGDDIYAAGGSGAVLHYNGSTWRRMSSGTTRDLYGIRGVASGEIFIVGESGTIINYDGASFRPMNRDTIDDLRALWCGSAIDVFAAGGSGTILRYSPPIIESISHEQGDQGTSLNLIITGQNLSGAGEVRLGAGIAVNSIEVLSAGQIEAAITIVAGAATGPRDLTVTTPGGSFTLPGCFTVKQALPSISHISPDHEKQGFTLQLTITGSNLSGASELRLGKGIAVNNFSVLSASQIAASITIAANAEVGARDVTVSTPGGSFTLPDGFTVKQAPPVITSINSDQGNRETGITVTITGSNLDGASELSLGDGIAVNSYTVISSGQITADISIDAGAVIGPRDVTVTTPGGIFTFPNSFTVMPALPVITSVSPERGSQGATVTLDIRGRNLDGARSLRLGAGVAVSSYNVTSPERMTASITIIAGSPVGPRDVTVTTAGGSFTLPGAFTVDQGQPVITSISPAYGTVGEELSVVISGSNLDEAISVSFGAGVAVKSFTNLSPTQVSVNLIIDDVAVIGSRDVTVTTPGGSSVVGNGFSIREKSTATLFVALIWVVIAAAIVLLIFILKILRKNRSDRL